MRAHKFEIPVKIKEFVPKAFQQDNENLGVTVELYSAKGTGRFI